jgi:hypothetical protein
MPIILAPREEREIRRIIDPDQPGQKVSKNPYQAIKPGHCGACLQSQKCRKHK